MCITRIAIDPALNARRIETGGSPIESSACRWGRGYRPRALVLARRVVHPANGAARSNGRAVLTIWHKYPANFRRISTFNIGAHYEYFRRRASARIGFTCQGNTKLSITRGNETEVQNDTFHLALRLTDGSLGNVEYDFLEGKNCTLVDGVIRCELDTTTYNRELDTTSKEHRSVAIGRRTGEMNLTLQSQTFDGTNTTSEPTITIKSFRTGVCHPAATAPLF